MTLERKTIKYTAVPVTRTIGWQVFLPVLKLCTSSFFHTSVLVLLSQVRQLLSLGHTRTHMHMFMLAVLLDLLRHIEMQEVQGLPLLLDADLAEALHDAKGSLHATLGKMSISVRVQHSKRRVHAAKTQDRQSWNCRPASGCSARYVSAAPTCVQAAMWNLALRCHSPETAKSLPSQRWSLRLCTRLVRLHTHTQETAILSCSSPPSAILWTSWNKSAEN